MLSEGTPTILVTGAGGFIGARIVEVLHLSGVTRPRAGIRRWATAARVGRFPVEIVPCDVLDPAQLERAMEGVDAVVHCAVGPAAVNIGGTRNVLEAARNAGARCVVHLSTVDVYGYPEGEVTEAHPFGSTGAEYGESKVEAERICQEEAGGLPIVILRPSIVYGPFSTLWTASYARRFQEPPWPFARAGMQGTCNLVYVDDVVDAVLLALRTPAAAGEAFNVNGPERPTWWEYFEAFNAALGLPPLTLPGARSASARLAVEQPLRAAAHLAARRMKSPLRAVAGRFRLAQSLLRSARSSILSIPTGNEVRLYGREVSFSPAKAERVLGYVPRFTMADGVALSAAWALHHGYVGGRPRPAVGGEVEAKVLA
jgi:nucleoside-diphosphate-sugar epimerase